MFYELPIDHKLLVAAMRDETPGLVHFLDLDTGGIFSVSALPDGEWDVGDNHPLLDFPERFVGIDRLLPEQERRAVADFAATLPATFLRRRLESLARGDSSLAAVGRVLAGHPEESTRWSEHLDRLFTERARHFLEENDIDTFQPQPEAAEESR